MPDMLFVPTILLLTVVMPLWIVMHYVWKMRSARGLTADQENMMVELWESARRMEERIAVLESILAADPGGDPAGAGRPSGRPTPNPEGVNSDGV